LYCDDIKSLKRINCVSILKVSLLFLLKWLNPILVFTTEEVFQILKLNENNNPKCNEDSIFLRDFQKINFRDQISFNNEHWDLLTKLKYQINQILEDMRNEKIIKSGLETKIHISVSDKFKNFFENVNLSDFLVCSNVVLNNSVNNNKMINLDSLNDIKVFVEKASGQKCDHCWKISEGSCERKSCPIK